MNNYPHPLQNWIPYKLTHTGGVPLCHWLNTFDKSFTEPFFDETIIACKSLLRLKTYYPSVSDLSLLNNWAHNFECIAPTAIIFHVSRCGSTLVSQLLGLNPHNIALAEVPFFDDVLRLPYQYPDMSHDDIDALLRSAIKVYGQKRNGNETNLFIKTDSWHIVFYKQLRALYPDVPFVLLYRSPDEVLNSHTKQRGIHAVPGIIEPQLFGFEPDKILNLNLDQYTAKVLERYFTLYLEVAENDNNTLLLNYNQGIIPIIQKIATFSNIPISHNEMLKMEQRSGYHSKHPGKVFTEERVKHIPGYLQEAMQLYEMVEALRCADMQMSKCADAG